MAAGYVVNKSTDGDGRRNPGMGAELLQLMPDIFFDVLERIEKSRSDRRGSRAILDSGAQILFGGVHQSAIGVIDDHDLLGAQEKVRYDQGAQGVIRNDAASIADDVSISLFQSQGASRKAGIHTSQDGEFAFGTRAQPAQFVRSRVNFVCRKDFVDDTHARRV